MFYGNGQQLVVGATVSKLVVQASYSDITRMVVGVQAASSVQELPENLMTGGALAGLLNFRIGETLDKSSNDIGRLAATLTLTFNAQHALGQDLLGQALGEVRFAANFFTVSQPLVVANTPQRQCSDRECHLCQSDRRDGGGFIPISAIRITA